MNIYSGLSWNEKQAAKKVACDARIAAAEKRTPQEQLARLDAKFGKGNGAAKERAKIARKLEPEKTARIPAKILADVAELLTRMNSAGKTKAKDRRAAQKKKRKGHGDQSDSENVS